MRELKGGGEKKAKKKQTNTKKPQPWRRDKIKRESTDAGKMTCMHYHKVLYPEFFSPFSSCQSKFMFLFMWK